MKHASSSIGRFVLRAVAIALLLSLLARQADAQYLASDFASNPAYNGYSWADSSNGGFGLNPWTFTTAGSGAKGRFIWSSTDNNSGDPASSGPYGNDVNSSGPGTNSNAAFGLYAESGNESKARRTFSFGSLPVGAKFSLLMDNGNVNSGARVGFRAFNASDETRLNVFFRGGDSQYTWQGNDTAIFSNSGINFTRSGIEVIFTLTSANGGQLFIRRLDGVTSATMSVTLGGTLDSGITGFELYNIGAGSGSASNVYFNAIAVPEPASLSLLVMSGMLLRRRGRRT